MYIQGKYCYSGFDRKNATKLKTTQLNKQFNETIKNAEHESRTYTPTIICAKQLADAAHKGVHRKGEKKE